MDIELLGVDNACAVDVALVEEHLALLRKKNKWNSVRSKFVPLCNALAKLEIEPRWGNSFDVAFTGDAAKLASVVRILRVSGWVTTAARPKRGDSSWYGWYTHKDSDVEIWLSFTSSVCRRVQVGTQMVEQPIYETRCGDDVDVVQVVEEIPHAQA